MDNNDISKKIGKAAKWSTITEIAAKLVTPVTSMILARLLAPEAFGIITSISMIVSLADMFSDAGFQKFLVQHEFKNEEEKNKNVNVAFWSNLGLSIFLWGLIAIFCKPIAELVGNPGLEIALIVAAVQLPLTSFSSIQMALFKRDFNFKSLFLVRIVSVFIPFAISIPLALLGYGFWALIIGSICGQLSNAILLTVKSKWRPRLFYRLAILKKMLSFSLWSLVEAISIWLTLWIDALIIGNALDSYYLGLYKTSLNMVNALMGIVTASFIPILFSALSRLQNDELGFNKMFNSIQKLVAYLVLPIGLGLYLYSDIATQIMLGDQWAEANKIIGIWALTSSILIVSSNFNSEVYRSKGRPQLSFAAQMIHLAFLIPVCLISLKSGFWDLVYSRALIRLESVVTGIIIMKFIIKFPIRNIFNNIGKPIMCTLLMGCLVMILRQLSQSMVWSILSIIICVIVYVITVVLVARKDVKTFLGFANKKF
ncbi:lipopolysaccharide biosynthesis protein [Paenibacillus sp. FSL H8-0548]|uniref:lipopolysaccharide biosynthesis protein n=1 Tax=Paenibacillus sp. FSL H8-0548 TaxID=1920422 RepID=UPI00096CB2B1|nr:lipopolysaccharide biosynthesis protein [Paenibacillus sp. FSL H8-0548]OMF32606.1 lipopolysaccharide biosynthesis protein [Paenibacillus sp. FSL H8-0548]